MGEDFRIGTGTNDVRGDPRSVEQAASEAKTLLFRFCTDCVAKLTRFP